jgi:hypothetical protein
MGQAMGEGLGDEAAVPPGGARGDADRPPTRTTERDGSARFASIAAHSPVKPPPITNRSASFPPWFPASDSDGKASSAASCVQKTLGSASASARSAGLARSRSAANLASYSLAARRAWVAGWWRSGQSLASWIKSGLLEDTVFTAGFGWVFELGFNPKRHPWRSCLQYRAGLEVAGGPAQEAHRAQGGPGGCGLASDARARCDIGSAEPGRRAGRLDLGAIIYHYPDLQELLLDAHRAGMERFYEQRQRALEGIDSTARKLVVTIASGLPTDSDDADVRLLCELGGAAARNSVYALLLTSLFDRQVSLYQVILESGAATGSFTLQQDSLAIARNLVALEDAYGYRIMARHGALDREAAIGLILDYARIATVTDCPCSTETINELDQPNSPAIDCCMT